MKGGTSSLYAPAAFPFLLLRASYLLQKCQQAWRVMKVRRERQSVIPCRFPITVPVLWQPLLFVHYVINRIITCLPPSVWFTCLVALSERWGFLAFCTNHRR